MNLGIIGSGGFSRFSVNAFLLAGDVKLVGVYDIEQHHALEFQDQFGGKIYQEMEDILADPGIELIYIASPPYLHYEQSKKALLAGRHVICEKPAALRSEEAKELVELAKEKQLLYTVNLMQRYNPLFTQVQQIIESKILGEFVHGFFENYAADEGLEPGHWMWDESKSGGIFIEHAVHFFDLFAGWLGEGKVVSSQKLKRPKQHKEYWSRVQAVVKYEQGLVNFYHGFDQAVCLDRQELRLEFERGEITLYEWIPVKIKLHGLVDNSYLEELKKIFRDAEISYLDSFSENNKSFKGRFKEFRADHRISLVAGQEAQKMDRYRQMLTSMFKDQMIWIKNPDHKRSISGINGYTSLKIAEEANNMAVKL
ncbi:MAG: Gfo/Idh/MocA family oxidoreductase [Bacteroidota bacterium]